MNYCIINRHRLYPAVGNSIKITYENPIIKDRDAQTMEIEFPLDIHQNRLFFGSTDRLDTTKAERTFDDAALYSDDSCVIRGRATVTAYTDTAVKLQIKSGIAVSEFSDYADTYIDQLTYATIFDGIDYINQTVKTAVGIDRFSIDTYRLCPVYDESNDVWLNMPTYKAYTDDNSQQQWQRGFNKPLAPQPSLRYVLRTVLKALGYTLAKDQIIDQYPWCDLYILNFRPATTIALSLPHWSVQTLLKEFRRLFNVAFVFDTASHTATIVSTAAATNDAHHEAADDFSTDYDEDGIEYYAASNIAYNLSDCSEWEHPDIEEETLASLTVKDYNSDAAIPSDTTLTEQQRRTTLFRIASPICDNTTQGSRYVYYKLDTAADDGDTYQLDGHAGQFQHLTREAASDSTVKLNLVPACVRKLRCKDLYFYNTPGPLSRSYSKLSLDIIVPTSTNDEELSQSSDPSSLANTVTVEDIIENDASATQDEAERIELYFIDSQRTAEATVCEKSGKTNLGTRVDYTNFPETWPTYRVTVGYPADNACGSFSLDHQPIRSDGSLVPHIGQLHSQAKQIDNHIQLTIKFLLNDGKLPDPKATYVFRGKRYIADKIELTVTDSGLSPLATGYFYALT